MQISRMFEIVYILLERGKATAGELAAHFEVSPRTIYRDVENLSAAGIPVYMSKGKGGGIRLVDSFVLERSVLTEQEQREILLAVQSLNAVPCADYGGVLSKLGALFQKGGDNWIAVDFTAWGCEGREGEVFALLRTAILNRQVVAFEYYGASGEATRRQVEPLQLVFKARSWYLSAFCRARQAPRFFKLARMYRPRATGEQFAPRPLPVPPTGETGAGFGRPLQFTLRIAPEAAYRALDEFDEGSLTRHADGSMTARAVMPHNEWVYGYILSFGASARVEEPAWLREAVAQRLRRALDAYGGAQ